MEPRYLILTSVFSIFGIGGLIIHIMGWVWLKQSKFIQEIPTSTIRSIAMGIVEIKGKVLAERTIKAPLSGKDCVAYMVELRSIDRNIPEKDEDVLNAGAKRFKESEQFSLKDKTGKVLVDPRGATMSLTPKFRYKGREPPYEVQSFMDKNNIRFSTTMLAKEWAICPDDDIYIMGTAGDNPYTAEASGQKNTDDIMIQAGKNENFFIISDKKENTVAREVLKKAWLSIIFGMIVFLGIGGALFYLQSLF